MLDVYLYAFSLCFPTLVECLHRQGHNLDDYENVFKWTIHRRIAATTSVSVRANINFRPGRDRAPMFSLTTVIGDWGRCDEFRTLSELDVFNESILRRGPRPSHVTLSNRSRVMFSSPAGSNRSSSPESNLDPFNLLVRMTRCVADAVAMRMAAALSLSGWYEYPKQFVHGSSGWVGVCATHGYVRSSHTGARVGTCSACDAERERCMKLEWSVNWLLRVALAVALGEVERRRSATEELLPALCVVAGRALWESLDDWTKRVCMLDHGSGQSIVVETELSLRFQLLELD